MTHKTRRTLALINSVADYKGPVALFPHYNDVALERLLNLYTDLRGEPLAFEGMLALQGFRHRDSVHPFRATRMLREITSPTPAQTDAEV